MSWRRIIDRRSGRTEIDWPRLAVVIGAAFLFLRILRVVAGPFYFEAGSVVAVVLILNGIRQARRDDRRAADGQRGPEER
jgi:hypothetical protein